MVEMFGNLVAKKNLITNKLIGKDEIQMDFLEFQSCAIMAGTKLMNGYFQRVLTQRERHNSIMEDGMDIDTAVVNGRKIEQGKKCANVEFIAEMFTNIEL